MLRGSPGWSATSAARAGPPIAVQLLCLPRRQAGSSGERPLGPRSDPDNGGGLLPSTRGSPGRAPAAPRNSRPYLSWRSVDSAWQAVDFGAVSRRVRRGPSQWNWRTVCAAWDPTRGNLRTGCALENLPRAWDLLIPCLPSSPRHPLPGSLALVPAAACGQSETLGSWTLRSRDSGSSDADQGQNLPAPTPPHSPQSHVALFNISKPSRTNSCCPNSDELPVWWLRQDKGFPRLARAGAGRLHASSGVKCVFLIFYRVSW